MREYGDRPLELYDSRLTTFYRLLPAVPKEVVNQESTAGLTGNFLKVTSTEKLFDIPKVYSSMEGWYSYKPTDRPFSHQPFNDLWITCLLSQLVIGFLAGKNLFGKVLAPEIQLAILRQGFF